MNEVPMTYGHQQRYKGATFIELLRNLVFVRFTIGHYRLAKIIQNNVITISTQILENSVYFVFSFFGQ